MTRARNAPACVAEIEATFLTRSLADWRTRLEGFTGVWAAALTPAEVHEHVQVEANGYLPELTSQEGARFRLPAPPMQFGGEAPAPRAPAPELGQHTEEILLELGHEWDAITKLRDAGALGRPR
jgi:crotonobetainyl-CoA:carnitine CoA-transferase CaiB-like acyl-CoA transferase